MNPVHFAECEETPPVYLTSEISTGSFVRIVGSGHYSYAELIDHKKFGKLVRKMPKHMRSGGGIKLLENEAKCLMIARHPNIVRLLGIEQDSDLHMRSLLIEYVSQGSLLELVEANKSLNQSQSTTIIRGICSGLVHLHEECKIILRDLKAENVLLDDDCAPRLSDFGFAKVLSSANERTYTLCGTPEFMAPEMVNKGGYGSKVDLWAFGCLLEYAFLRDGFRLEPSLENGLNDIVISYLKVPEEKRYTANQLLHRIISRGVDQHSDPE